MSNSKNKIKRRAWPPKRRAEQAKRIQAQKPWLKTTGPKTPEGKKTVSRNAYRHGFRSQDMRELLLVLRLQRAYVKAIQSNLQSSILSRK